MAKRVAQGNKSKTGSTSTKRRNTSANSSRGTSSARKLETKSATERITDKLAEVTPAPIKETFEDANFKEVVSNFSKSAWAMYMAGGVGTFFLARFALRYFRNHPEITEYIRDNMHTVEAKLREYRDNYRGEDNVAHH